MAKRVKVVLEPFKLGDFPIRSLTLQKDVKVRFLAAPEGLLTEGNGAVPDAPDAYDHYTPILTDVDRRPYINLTPAKEDWLRTPYGIDPTRASTLFDKNGIPEVLRLAIEADDACERLFLAMDKKIKQELNKNFRRQWNISILCVTRATQRSTLYASRFGWTCARRNSKLSKMGKSRQVWDGILSGTSISETLLSK